SPGSPEPSPQVGDEDPDLDSERARQRLADRDPLPHLLLRQPAPPLDEFPFHLADERHRPAEAERPQPQVIHDEAADSTARADGGLGPVRHDHSSATSPSDRTYATRSQSCSGERVRWYAGIGGKPLAIRW